MASIAKHQKRTTFRSWARLWPRQCTGTRNWNHWKIRRNLVALRSCHGRLNSTRCSLVHSWRRSKNCRSYLRAGSSQRACHHDSKRSIKIKHSSSLESSASRWTSRTVWTSRAKVLIWAHASSPSRWLRLLRRLSQRLAPCRSTQIAAQSSAVAIVCPIRAQLGKMSRLWHLTGTCFMMAAFKSVFNSSIPVTWPSLLYSREMRFWSSKETTRRIFPRSRPIRCWLAEDWVEFDLISFFNFHNRIK